MQWVNWLGVAVGTFSCCGGLFDWDWFMELPKAQRMVNLLGREGARVFYGLGGGLCCIICVWLIMRG